MTNRNSALSALTRRNMLMGVGALGVASVFAACGSVASAPAAQPGTSAEEEAPAKTEEAPAPAERVTVLSLLGLNARHAELYPTLIEEPFENDYPNIDLETFSEKARITLSLIP